MSFERTAMRCMAALGLSTAALSVGTASFADTPAQQNPAQQAPAQQTPAQQNPAQQPPATGAPNGPKTIARGARKFTTDALVYNGDGAWAAEVPSIENILQSNKATFREVSSDQLNSMSVDDLAQFGTIIWPGGEAGTMAQSLSDAAKKNLRDAVQQRGVSWLGFCAGSFIAVEPSADLAKNPDYGLSILDAPTLQYYMLEAKDEAAGKDDIDMTMETFADGSKRDLIWYGGPITPGGANTVVAKYPTGDPAISQLWSGNGLVILSGPHPAATQAVRDAFGLQDSDGVDFDIAWKLMDAAIHQKDLQTFPN